MRKEANRRSAELRIVPIESEGSLRMGVADKTAIIPSDVARYITILPTPIQTSIDMLLKKRYSVPPVEILSIEGLKQPYLSYFGRGSDSSLMSFDLMEFIHMVDRTWIEDSNVQSSCSWLLLLGIFLLDPAYRNQLDALSDQLMTRRFCKLIMSQEIPGKFIWGLHREALKRNLK